MFRYLVILLLMLAGCSSSKNDEAKRQVESIANIGFVQDLLL